MPADGSTLEPELLSSELHPARPGSWSPDGNELIVATLAGDILALPIDGEQEPHIVIGTEYRENAPRLSPDGRWLAYSSNVTGGVEIWVRPYPGPGAPVRMTSSGGDDPVWSRDGRELFYVEGQRGTPDVRLMGVRVETTPEFRFEPPQVLVDGGFATSSRFSGAYDVASDGRFVMIKSSAPQATDAQSLPDQLTVVTHWFEELNRLVPTEN